VFFSKGLEPDTKLCAAEIVEVTVPKNSPWIVIGGPMIAEELQAGARGHGVLAGPGVSVRRELESILPPESMSFSETSRARDVSLCGVLKNVYALTYGLGVGLGWSPIALSDLWKRCESELIAAADRCGIEREVVSGPAGIDDFHVTGGSPHSRNRNAGVQLATAGTFDQAAEGIAAFPLLIERFPELKHLDCLHSLAAIFDHAPVKRVFQPISSPK
jgi:glycerol-3-phosphate dehydrogenase (NAD(P)+)